MNLSLDCIHLSTANAMDYWFIHAKDRIWDRPLVLATYSSKEKRDKVFQHIVTACSKEFTVIELPQDNEVVL